MRVCVSMGLNLRWGPRPCFSKTARSHPLGDEAGGHRLGVVLITEGRWALTDDLVERAAEGAQAVESHFEADLGHRQFRLDKERHRPFDASALQIAVRRLAEGRTKCAAEVGGGDECDPS